jgi:glycosyltransferase
MKNIKISIITVVKNGMPFLKDAIKSVDNQTYKNIEQIIVYSKSIDDTENYLTKLKNKKIIYDKNSVNKFGSLNLAVKYCSGDYVGILHADDFFYHQKTIENLVNFINKNNSDAIYGNIKFCKKYNVNKITRVWTAGQFKWSNLKLGWMPPHTSIFLKKKILEDNLYSEKYSISGDYDFILKIFLNTNYSINYFNEHLIVMRTGGDSTNIKLFYKKFSQDLMIAKKFFKNYIFCIIFKILRKINQFLKTS